MGKLLITGATGFIGRNLVSHLAQDHALSVVATVRTESKELPAEVRQLAGMDINPETDWQAALDGVVCVIHLAGMVPAALPDDKNESTFRRINVDGSLNLARQAAQAGVRRFIFISSIKVNGETTQAGQPFSSCQEPAPEDAYGVSKYEAEQALLKHAAGTDMDVVIIRPPLVYGPGVKGNFRSMMAWTNRQIPLPLGAIRNRRSLVAVGNLSALIATCISHPRAGNEVFLVSDNEDLSTTELLRRIGKALDRPARLLPFPAWTLILAATLLGKKGMVQRLCGNLQVDITHTCNTLGWMPPLTMAEALKETAKEFQARQPELSHTPAVNQQKNTNLLRTLDIIFALAGLFFGSPILAGLWMAGYCASGSPLFRQQRLGRHQKPFTMIKFRTMRPETPSVATHLADKNAITALGQFMRKTKLDELPQLWNVLKGDMSLVGPRPGLPNQTELAAERAKRGVFAARPGITGLAQVNNINMSTPRLLAQTDMKMLQTLTIANYFKYIFLTITGKGSGDAITKP